MLSSVRFTWDKAKDASNQRKHGIAFPEAAKAFGDPHGFALADPRHSQTESRFFWFGKVGSRVMTVRFVCRVGIRILGAAWLRQGKKLYEEKNH